MDKHTVISNRQMLAIVALATVGTSSLYAPATLVHYGGRDAWYLVLMGGAIGIINVSVFVWLNRLYPGRNYISVILLVFGRWIGGPLALMSTLFYIDVGTWVLREFSQFFVIALEPTIPIVWYLIVGALMCGYAVRLGIEVIARVSEIIFFITMAAFIAIYSVLINQYHPEYLLPVLEHGLLHPLKGLMLSVSWFGDVMFISMILNHVRQTKQTPYYIAGAMGVILFILLLAVVTCIVVLGAEATSTFTYPSISLIQNISLFRNIERFDAALVAVWVMSAFVKITVYFWAGLQALSTVFRLRHPGRFVWPLAGAFVISSQYKAWGLIEISNFYDQYAWYFVLFQLGLPMLVLLAALARGKLSAAS